LLLRASRSDRPEDIATTFEVNDMVRTILAVTAASLIGLTGCASNPTGAQVGTGVGAVAGGVVGNAVFGNTLGTVGGAAAGALIGNEVGKRRDNRNY
jgi:osmotically inducible lipoprotein OsmB